jgi:uncharacterized protein YqjF (DUF2071 family)
VANESALQRRTLEERAHRPWPLPDTPWLQGQTWCDLLFAHWRVPADALRRVVPPVLPLHLDPEGSAWLGITPFVVRGLRARGTPPLPWVSHFPELNVRTYVELGGKPGIYFLSLDAARLPAVAAARRLYRLPYFHAEMEAARADRRITYRSVRRSGDGPPAAFRAAYGPQEGGLDGGEALARWLAERYCLYVKEEGSQVLRGEIHHPLWPLESAWADIGLNTMGEPFGLDLRGRPLLHFAGRQDTLVWPLRPLL